MQRYIQTNSITTKLRWYRSSYGSPAQSRDSIRRWHNLLIRFGTVADHQRSGKHPVSLEDVREIKNASNENPGMSTRDAERELRIPRSTIWDVLRKKAEDVCVQNFISARTAL